MIELKQYRKNLTEVTIGNKIIVFSYQTPVILRDESIGKTYVGNLFLSKTTSEHINHWLYVNQLSPTYIHPQQLADYITDNQ